MAYTPNPLTAADQMQRLAMRAVNNKLAFAMTGLSVALLGVMVIKEFRDAFFHHHGRYPDRDRGR